MHPKYSLMILTQNRLQQLQTLIGGLESRLAHGDMELLIWDNGSDKETVDFVSDLTLTLRGTVKVKTFLQNENVGVARGRAELMKAASGDTLIFMDSDVEIISDAWLDRLMDALEPENVGLAGPAGSFVMWTPDGAVFSQAIPGQCDVVAGWCQAFKKEVLDAGVAMDTEYGFFWEEDSDFCMQVRAAGWDVATYHNTGLRHFPGQTGAELVDRRKNMARFKEKWQGRELIREEGAY